METQGVKQITIPIRGMDCIECTQHVKQALERVAGVSHANVLLAAEKAIVDLEVSVEMVQLKLAVEQAGYSVPIKDTTNLDKDRSVFQRLGWAFFLTVGIVLFVVVLGEWMGWIEQLSERLPIGIYLGLLILGGWPVFKGVARTLYQRQITSHTLMTIGVVAAALVGEWATAVVIVMFMRIGDWVEHQTTDGARKAIHALIERVPDMACVERDGVEVDLRAEQIQAGDIVICRPGETVAADGEILEGSASVDNSAITGESLPADVGVGSTIFAGSIILDGGFKLLASRVGEQTTIGRVIRLVEEAEANKGQIQRFADKFTAYYLPIVLGIAALTYIIRRDTLAAVAVLVVVCSCAIALATPIAMLASIGTAGKRGMLIKGGRFLEALPRVDVLLLDKTGTLTMGAPVVTDILPLHEINAGDLIQLAAGVERYSEHPIGKAIRHKALHLGIALPDIKEFQSFPGLGAQSRIKAQQIRVGNRQFLQAQEIPAASELEADGKTVVYVEREGALIGLIGLTDQLRPDVPLAMKALRQHGYARIELLTGDHQAAAIPIADALGVAYRAGLMPEDKVNIVRDYQAQGHVVAMIGDGINDAPALAQADVGIAMGAVGTDIAIHAADIAVMSEDWSAIPALVALSKRTMGVVRLNLIFTAVYNLVGITLAATGILPPALAAAAQSLPDVGILVNSSRLLRFKDSLAQTEPVNLRFKG